MADDSVNADEPATAHAVGTWLLFNPMACATVLTFGWMRESAQLRARRAHRHQPGIDLAVPPELEASVEPELFA